MADEKKVVRRVKAKTDKLVQPTKPKIELVTDETGRKVSRKMADKIAKREARHPDGRKVFILFRPFAAFGRYVRNSWRELRVVEWPSRRATWTLTFAVLAFTVFFAAFVMLCDWLFQLLVKDLILK